MYPLKNVHKLHKIHEKQIIFLLLNLSEKTPPKIPKTAKLIVKAAPAKMP
jgi:hypothetical protein